MRYLEDQSDEVNILTDVAFPLEETVTLTLTVPSQSLFSAFFGYVGIDC